MHEQPKSSAAVSALIKSISIRGFKSFGEEPQKFSFIKGFNLIVGANGSGKSNILDAIAFALCTKSSALRVRYNSELQSTETKEPCQVLLELAVSGEDRVRTLCATINTDDSRQYKVDGRLKSVKDVKEMLQELRLYLEGTSAIVHQSQVSELADNNSSKLLASIISEASGAGRWNAEVEKAQQELKKTRKGLDEIQENILLLEKVVEKDQTCLKVLSRIKQEFEKVDKLLLKFKTHSMEKEDLIQQINNNEEQVKDLENNVNRQKFELEENQKMYTFLKKEIETSKKQLNEIKQSGHCIETPKLLNQAIQMAKDDDAVLQGMLDDVLYRQEKIRMEKRDLQIEVLSIDELNKTVQAYEDELQVHAQQLASIENKIEDAKREKEERSSEYFAMTEVMDRDKIMISEIQGNIATLRNTILNLKANVKKAEKELEALPLTEGNLASVSKEKILDKSDYLNKKRKLNTMMEELKKIKPLAKQFSLDEQIAFNEQMGRLELFKERWASIVESIDILTEGIENTKSSVERANEAAYQEIRHSFMECCEMFFPTKGIDLIKTGQVVENGIKFSFSNSKVLKGVSDGWKTNLEELSGGQRTVLSLAFVLMVAKYSRSSVYLMDEVDAALDEQNQQTVAKLIKSVIGEDTQVICVSHNITFQQHSDRIIQVSKVEGSTKHMQSQTIDKSEFPKKSGT